MKGFLSAEIKESRTIVEMFFHKVMRNPKIKNPYKNRDLYIGI